MALCLALMANDRDAVHLEAALDRRVKGAALESAGSARGADMMIECRDEEEMWRWC